jgi:putative transposase
MLFFLLLHCLTFLLYWSSALLVRRNIPYSGRGKSLPNTPIRYRFPKKPDWVPKEIVRMKALMPKSGCRCLALSFNRRFAHKDMRVGKTYVSDVIRKHRYEIRVLRKKLKHRRPRPMPLNRVWAMDLTGKQDSCGQMHNILGIVEHGSRASLSLKALGDKTSITLLRHLLDAVERYGKPKFLRTDNEAVFTSRLFRFGLWLLGINHQRTEKGCPWMNGRVERFFGTLKSKLDNWEVDSREQLNNALGSFRFWYNHVRPHSNLEGRTPVEVWAGKDVFAAKKKKELWFEAWDGLLTGYYLRF